MTPDKDDVAKKMKVEGIDDPADLPVPRVDFSELQKKLEQRASEHEIEIREGNAVKIPMPTSTVFFSIRSKSSTRRPSQG